MTSKSYLETFLIPCFLKTRKIHFPLFLISLTNNFFSCDKIFLKRGGSSTEVQDFFSIIILLME